MTLLSAAVSSLPTDLNLFVDKLFSIVGFICLPLLALTLILLLLLMLFFIVSVMIDCFRKTYHDILKHRLESEDDNHVS